MPNTRSAQKQVRVARRRQLRNKPVRSLSKTLVKKAEGLILTGQVEEAGNGVVSAIRSLDKAAQRGIIHPNNAARRKSRLMEKINQAKAKPKAA